jgi:hypothetical protein
MTSAAHGFEDVMRTFDRHKVTATGQRLSLGPLHPREQHATRLIALRRVTLAKQYQHRDLH